MAANSKKLLLSDIVASEKIDQIPSNYIRPVSDRPNLESVVHDSIPLIDLHDLYGPNRSHVIEQIGRACRDYGIFHILNHGVQESTIANMMHVAKAFFKLPEEEMLKMYADDRINTPSGVYNSFGNVSNWRDYMLLNSHPIEDYIHEWPTNPTSFQDHAAEYARSIRGLSLQLMEAISESLGLDKDYIKKQIGKHNQHLVLNYYPPCPQPDLTYGLPRHSDFTHLTILLQGEVPGLQVLKNDRWIVVNPVPNSFIVNIGDQVQVMSNGKYKSVVHRALVNSERERISIPTFTLSSLDAVMGPAPELVTDDEPAVYKQFTFGEYYGKYFTDLSYSKINIFDLFNCYANIYHLGIKLVHQHSFVILFLIF